jgi:hypothetical protein
MGETYYDSYGNIGHNQRNDKGKDYSLFEVREIFRRIFG